jgi:hypothetical protein
MGSEFQPASVVQTRRIGASSGSSWPEEMLLIRFIDNEAAVESQLLRVTKLNDAAFETTMLGEAEADAVWAAVADFDNREIQLRISVRLSSVAAEFETALITQRECVASADIGTGIIRVAFDADQQIAVDQIRSLRSRLVATGAVVVEKAPAEVRREVDAWGEILSTADLMRSIKQQFDPQSILNPGKFVLGL